ncbi:MAG TPA: hypothetical protein PLK31_13005, partial [Chloroflexota bacterium]|nr:hypothetical protein [Chloroflexota bacterium]
MHNHEVAEVYGQMSVLSKDGQPGNMRVPDDVAKVVWQLPTTMYVSCSSVFKIAWPFGKSPCIYEGDV